MTKKHTLEFGTPHVLALGAGIASALLFSLAGRGTFAAMLLAYLSPLPLMIAALGFGTGTGLISVITGVLGIAILGALASVNPGEGVDVSELRQQTLANVAQIAAIYFLSLGFPSFCLGLLGRTDQQSTLAPQGFAHSLASLWRGPHQPVARAIAFALLASALLVTAGSLWIWSRHGGFQAVVDKTVEEILPLLSQLETGGIKWPADFKTPDIARIIVLAVGPFMAASTFFMLIVNLWLAGRVVQVSGLLPQPWPDIPHNLRLPRVFAPLFILACVLTFLGGPGGFIALIFAVTFGLGFALQGLGAIHDLTRGLSYRVPLLIIVYLAFVLLMPWPLTLLGLVDTIFPLGKRRDITKQRPDASLSS